MLIEGTDYRRAKGWGLLPAPNMRRYVTLRTITAETYDWTIVVDAGFDFDGPTGLPVFKWIPGLKDWTQRTMRAACIHDALYEPKGKVTLSPRPKGGRRLERAEADIIFRAICEQDGVPSWLAWLANMAILTVGGRFWKPEDGVYR